MRNLCLYAVYIIIIIKKNERLQAKPSQQSYIKRKKITEEILIENKNMEINQE